MAGGSGSHRIAGWRSNFSYGVGIVGGFFGVLLVVLLARWFFASVFGYDADPLFVRYSDGSGLYYFNVFGYIRSVADAFAKFGDSFASFISTWKALPNSDFLGSAYNAVVYPLNILLFLLKMIFFIPLEILFTIFGLYVPGWLGEEGWISQFVNWWFPTIEGDVVTMVVDSNPDFWRWWTEWWEWITGGGDLI